MSRAAKYPWGEWFASDGFTVTRGVDFDGRTDTFIQMIRQRAIGRGIKLRISVSDDGQTVRVRIERAVQVMTPQQSFDIFSVV